MSGEQPDALMVPQTALGSSQLGKYVYVVGEDNKVEQRLVSLGPTDGDLVAVLNGVCRGRPGDHRQSAEDRPWRAGAAVSRRSELPRPFPPQRPA